MENTFMHHPSEEKEKHILRKEKNEEELIHQLEEAELLIKRVSDELSSAELEHDEQNIPDIDHDPKVAAIDTSKNNFIGENSQEGEEEVFQETKKSPYHDYQMDIDSTKPNSNHLVDMKDTCLLYTSPSPRDS